MVYYPYLYFCIGPPGRRVLLYYCIFVLLYLFLYFVLSNPLDTFKWSVPLSISRGKKFRHLITVHDQIQIQESSSIQKDEQKVYGIHDPANYDFDLNMWSSTKADDLRSSLKRLNKVELSKSSKEILEAILFASGSPVLEEDLKDKMIHKKEFKKEIESLRDFYQNRGINLIKAGNKWSFRTAESIKDDLTIFKTQKRKLSRAAIETLSIIAYQQPITRSEIENIRGVQMGRGSIDHLVEIGWIKPSGRKNIPGKPALWVTTELFMEHFGIENISDLPSKEELKASGFLEKRSAIATITDIAGKNEFLEDKEVEDEETLEDFISEESAK